MWTKIEIRLAMVKITRPHLFVALSCISVLWQAGGSTGLLMDLAANEKAVHSDFFNGKISLITYNMACFALYLKSRQHEGNLDQY